MPETRILPPSTHLAPGCNTNSSNIVDQPLPGIKFNFASLFLIQISSHLLPGTYIKESFASEYNSNQEISPIVKFSDKKEDKAKILKLRREAPPMPRSRGVEDVLWIWNGLSWPCPILRLEVLWPRSSVDTSSGTSRRLDGTVFNMNIWIQIQIQIQKQIQIQIQIQLQTDTQI